MSAEQITNFALKPASVAVVTGAAIAAWRPGQNVLVGGKQIPLALLVAGGSFLASEVSELINSYVFDHIPAISVLSHPMHTALNIGTQTAVVSAFDNYLSPGLVGDQGLAEIAALAALGEIGGNYLAKEWLAPWVAQMRGADSM